MTARPLRCACAAVLAFAALVAGAAPAWAHGVATAGPPNWSSAVTSAPVEDLTWTVVGVDAALRLDNDGDAEVLVRGYADEPYLRIGPDGVFENRRSRTTWFNRDRLADLTDVQVPDDVDNDAPAAWVQVAEEPTWTWFDHRVHWVNPRRLPPAVAADPGSEQLARAWEVPAERDGQSVGPTGELVWHPTPFGGAGPWLWPTVAAVALAAVVVARRRGAAAAMVGVGLIVVAVVGLVHEVGSFAELGAVAPEGAMATAAIRGALVVAVALASVRGLRHGERWGPALLVVASLLVAVVVGARELEALRAPVPRGPFPGLVTRALVAVAVAAPVAAVAAGWGEERTPWRLGTCKG